MLVVVSQDQIVKTFHLVKFVKFFVLLLINISLHTLELLLNQVVITLLPLSL